MFATRSGRILQAISRLLSFILSAVVFAGAVLFVSCASKDLRAPQSTISETPDFAGDPEGEESEDESGPVETQDAIAVERIESPNRNTSMPTPLFDWPVDEARMTRGYFLKDPRGKRKRPHLGVDLAAPRGTPIYASHDGLVIYVGRQFKGYGRMIMIEGKNGWASLYAHLTKSRVKEGQEIRQGDLIGDMGRTGRATGVHLHFEIRKITGPVDPLVYLPRSPRFAGMKMDFDPEHEASLAAEDRISDLQNPKEVL